MYSVKKKFGLMSLIICLASSIFALVYATSAVALDRVADDETVRKALLTGVQYCYRTGAIASSFSLAAERTSSFQSVGDLVVGGTDWNYVALPTGLTGIYDNGVSCEQLLLGYNGFSVGPFGGDFDGVFKLFGKDAFPSEYDDRVQLLESMGYEMVDDGDGGASSKNVERRRFYFMETVGKYREPEQVSTEQIVAELDDERRITNLSIDNVTASYTYRTVPFFSVTDDGKIALLRAQGNKAQPDTTTAGVGSTWDEFLEDLRRTLSSAGDSNGNFSIKVGPQQTELKYEYIRNSDDGGSNVVDDASGSADFEIPSSGTEDGLLDASSKAINYLSDGAYPDWTALDFSDQEKLHLLTLALKDWFFEGLEPGEYWVCDVADWADYGSFSAEIGASPDLTRPSSECRINTELATKTEPINGFTVFRNYDLFDASGATKLDLSQTIAEINRLLDEIPEDEELTPDTGIDTGTTDSDGEEDPCFAEAGALGWIMCPVIRILDENMTDIYAWVEDNFLQVNVDIFSNEANGIEETWDIFRNIANIFLIIAIIIVIISQLTGVGVSNYGIKKALPRIVIAAILINLSYIICELAIDLSNVLGASLKNIFEGLVEVDSKLRGGAPAGFAIGSLAIIGATAVVITVLNPAILLTLLLFLLSGVIAVLFLWILLVVRQAGLIIGVIIVPIMIACYMLPNLQNIFKRYLKIMQGFLLLYPICGLVVGGGSFVAKVLVNVGAAMPSDEGATPFFLAGMILQVLPFFLVPMLLKGSFAAMGNLGAKITGFGTRLGGKIDQGIKRSEGYKDLQRRGLERKMRLRAGLDKTGNVSKNPLTRVASIGFGRNRRRMAANAVLDKNASIGRYGNKEFVAAQAARRQVEQDAAEVKATEDLIKTERLSDGNKLIDSSAEMGKRYEQALRDNDTVKIKAYQNLMSGKDDTRTELHAAVKRAEAPRVNRQTGAVEAPAASSSALRTHASNLTNNHASEYKNNARSTFDHAAAILQNQPKPIASFEQNPKLIDSLKSETLGGMDDTEFGYLANTVRANPDKADAFYNACYDALHNDVAMNNVKESRKSEIAKFAALAPKARLDSGSLPIRQAPMPSGATMTDSGIIIGHENMSDHEIAQYAKEMQQFNTRQRQTGGQGRTGGQSQSGQGGQG